MNTRRAKFFLFAFVLLLAACGKQAQSIPPTIHPAPPTEIKASPTQTPAEVPTETASEIPAEVPPSTDPSLFGALAKSEINPLAAKIHEAVFIKVMDGFAANGNIIEYQIIASEVFPGESGLVAEIYYNVRTSDSSWLLDGGTQADDNWILNKCNRFDFVNTETEFQLKNRRTCN